MATKTILEVQHDLLSKGHKFVLTSRFTQDCLENTFSCIRQRNPVPTPVEFHYGLPAVTVGQFLSTNHTGSYQDDAADHLVDFLDTQTSICNASDIVRLEQLADPSPPNFTKTESCVLYHLAGYIVKRVISFSLCEECHCALVEAPANVTSQRAVLLEMKEFKKGALYRPSDEVFTLLKDVEQLFRSVTNDSLMESSNVVAQLEREAMSLHSNLPSCHELKKKIVTTYIRLRLRIQSKCIRAERKVNNHDKGHLASKSQTKKVTTTRQTSSQKVTKRAISFLQDIVHLFREIKIGPKGWRKPVQSGVIMATTSILAIQEEMLSRGHKFVLTSRFTQDCLENTFSCVRSKNPVPTPVEFHHALRVISVGQFLTTINSGSYQEDDSSFLADFLDRVEEKVTPSVRVEELTMVDRAAPDLTKTEKCILFHLAGYIVHKVIKFSSICGNCKTATQHSDDSPVEENSMLLKFKEYKSGALYHPSQDVYDIIYHIEELFKTKAGSAKCFQGSKLQKCI
ncbi:uncharacterized protein V6R79_022247 [Siganus canaliculatus]